MCRTERSPVRRFLQMKRAGCLQVRGQGARGSRARDGPLPPAWRWKQIDWLIPHQAKRAHPGSHRPQASSCRWRSWWSPWTITANTSAASVPLALDEFRARPAGSANGHRVADAGRRRAGFTWGGQPGDDCEDEARNDLPRARARRRWGMLKGYAGLPEVDLVRKEAAGILGTDFHCRARRRPG